MAMYLRRINYFNSMKFMLNIIMPKFCFVAEHWLPVMVCSLAQSKSQPSNSGN